MRLVVGLFVTLIFCDAAAAGPKLLWEAKGLAQPESVVQDPATGAIYVSNIAGAIMQKDGNGFIAKLRPDGTVITREWVKGLNAPTGLALHDHRFAAAEDPRAGGAQRHVGLLAKPHADEVVFDGGRMALEGAPGAASHGV